MPSATKAHRPVAIPSVLERMARFFEETGPLRLNFEDLSGITHDVPDFRLKQEHLIHCGDFCLQAKSCRQGHLDCVRNKFVANRVATRREEGFIGSCHLGLTELVEPLVYRGRVLGAFYYGAVVVQGTEDQGRRKIERYARRRSLDPQPLLDAFSKVPVISPDDLPMYRERLQLMLGVALKILEAHALPLERYRTEMIAMPDYRSVPPLVMAAMRQVQREYAAPINVASIAAALKCHPDYLSRVFKKSVPSGLANYILRVRIDRARALITAGKLSLGDIAWQVGFQDQSHFTRAFKKLTGVAPGSYRAGHAAGELGQIG